MCCWCLLLCCSCWMCRPWYVLLSDWILNVNWPKVKYNCSWGVCIECHTTCLRINIPVMWISGVQWEDRSYKSRFLLFHLCIGITITCSDNYVLFRNINPLNAELNPICYLLALLGAHHFLHVSRIRVNTSTHCSGCKQVKG